MCSFRPKTKLKSCRFTAFKRSKIVFFFIPGKQLQKGQMVTLVFTCLRHFRKEEKVSEKGETKQRKC